MKHKKSPPSCVVVNGIRSLKKIFKMVVVKITRPRNRESEIILPATGITRILVCDAEARGAYTIFIICGQRQFWLAAFQSCEICGPCRSRGKPRSFSHSIVKKATRLPSLGFFIRNVLDSFHRNRRRSYGANRDVS